MTTGPDIVGNGPYTTPNPPDPPQPGMVWDTYIGQWGQPSQGYYFMGGYLDQGSSGGGSSSGGSSGSGSGGSSAGGVPTVPFTDVPDIPTPPDQPPDWFQPFAEYAASVANMPLDFGVSDEQAAAQDQADTNAPGGFTFNG